MGIEIEDVRLTEDEDFISRELLKTNPIISNNRIISNPVGTVVRLSDEEANVFFSLWGNIYLEANLPYSAAEGTTLLMSHYRRERSSKLITAKIVRFQEEHGSLFCEICGFSFGNTYPEILGKGFIEAHHKVPLSKIDSVVKTTLEDLLLVCSNCHRMTH